MKVTPRADPVPSRTVCCDHRGFLEVASDAARAGRSPGSSRRRRRPGQSPDDGPHPSASVIGPASLARNITWWRGQRRSPAVAPRSHRTWSRTQHSMKRFAPVQCARPPARARPRRHAASGSLMRPGQPPRPSSWPLHACPLLGCWLCIASTRWLQPAIYTSGSRPRCTGTRRSPSSPQAVSQWQARGSARRTRTQGDGRRFRSQPPGRREPVGGHRGAPRRGPSRSG